MGLRETYNTLRSRMNQSKLIATGARGRRASRGFTMVEMLAALLIVALLSGVVATGVGVAFNVQKQATFASQSAVLSDTINSALSEAYHTGYTDENGYHFIFQGARQDSSTGAPEVIFKTEGGKQVLYLTWNAGNKEARLLNAGAYADCEVTSGDFSAGSSGSYTITSTTGTSLSKEYRYFYRSLAS